MSEEYLPLKTYEIWGEGVFPPANESRALMFSAYLATSFDHAVERLIEEFPEEKDLIHKANGVWFHMGSRIYDNRDDAVGAYG